MTRTKALVVVGCIMLALAVMALLELKQETTPPAGQMVTGALNTTEPPVRTLAEAPRAGALVPLDQGTLHPDSTALPPPQEASRPATAEAPSATEAKPLMAPPVAVPSTVPSAVPSETPSAVPSTVPSETPSAQPSTPPAVAPEATPAAPQTPDQEPAKVPQKTAQPTSEPAKSAQTTPDKVTPEQTKPAAKPEQVKPAAKPEQEKPAVKPDDAAGDKNAVRAIDTAGPVKVEADQKAIVWTRLELAGKNVVFRISGAEKLEGKAFVLPDPDRFVVDLQGAWAMRLPTVPANAHLKKIRAGKHEANTRLVMDLAGARTCQMVRINPTTLEFRIRQ